MKHVKLSFNPTSPSGTKAGLNFRVVEGLQKSRAEPCFTVLSDYRQGKEA